MSRHHLRFALFASACCGALQAAPVYAQAEDSAAPSDIIVTARRIEERLQDVPISITVFNQEQLDRQNIVNSADLVAYTPSLSANSLFGSANTSFSIRGFVQDVGTQPSVGVYFADVVAPRAATSNIAAGDGAGPGAFFDLQNVQILKGPQGTLFGRNTTGGAILLVPQKPTSKYDAYIEGSYGNYNMFRMQAMVNAPLGDNARLRIGIDRQKRQGYMRNTSFDLFGVSARRFSNVNYTAIRGSLVVDIAPELENYTIVSYTKSDTNADAQKVIACNPAPSLGPLTCAQLARHAGEGFYTVQSTYQSPGSRSRTWQAINTTTWTASDSLTVKNIFSYGELVQQLRSPLFGTEYDLHDRPNLAALLPAGTFVQGQNSTPLPYAATAQQYTLTDELQFQGSVGERLTWQAGGYFEISRPLGVSGTRSPFFLLCQDLNAGLCANPTGTGRISLYEGRTRFRNVGIYAQGSYELAEGLKATAGLRYTWDKVRNRTVLKTFTYPTGFAQGLPTAFNCTNPDAALPDCVSSPSAQSKRPTWLLGLDYKPVNDVLLYAKWTRGYRAGGVAAQVPTAFNTFGPEKVDAYEGGVKASFGGDLRGIFNLSAFYNDFSNQQLLVGFVGKPGTSVPNLSGITNAGASRIYGAEVEASIRPFAGFTLDGRYTYLNTRLTAFAPVTVAANSPYMIASSARQGDPLVASPRHKAAISARYELPVDSSIGEVSFGAIFTYTGSQVGSPSYRGTNGRLTSASYLKSRQLLDLNFDWDAIAGTGFDLSLFANNVTKEKYFIHLGGQINSTGQETVQVGPPRMYGIRLRYNFGE